MAVSVRLDPVIEAKLTQQAKLLGITKSDFIKDAIERVLGMKNPAALLREAQAAGLLTPDALAQLLKDAMRRRAGAARATAAGSVPLSMKEIQAEVHAVRRARKNRAGADLLLHFTLEDFGGGRSGHAAAARVPQEIEHRRAQRALYLRRTGRLGRVGKEALAVCGPAHHVPEFVPNQPESLEADVGGRTIQRLRNRHARLLQQRTLVFLLGARRGRAQRQRQDDCAVKPKAGRLLHAVPKVATPAE